MGIKTEFKKYRKIEEGERDGRGREGEEKVSESGKGK
jgi:hypothetical protein